MPELEARLLSLLEASPRCIELGVAGSPSSRFGVEIHHEDTVVGIWSERNGRLGFRNLASWEPRLWAYTPEEALTTTIAMAAQRRWLD